MTICHQLATFVVQSPLELVPVFACGQVIRLLRKNVHHIHNRKPPGFRVFIVHAANGLAVKLNQLERSFARALDQAEFVLWWYRNPDKKAYAVRVVRSEHDHYFYPDFVVCLNHCPDDLPMQRLLETKESTKDAARKAQHSPTGYGKVLFLTPDGSRLRWVQDNGSVGDVVDLNAMGQVLKRFAQTRPVAGQ